MKEMTHKERVEATVNGDIPDRAPVCDFGNMAPLTEAGVELQACRFDPELTARIMEDWVNKTRTDMYVGVLELKGMFMDLPGIEVSLPPNSPGAISNTFYNSIEDIDTKEFPDAFNRKECPYLYKTLVDPMKRTRELVKTGALSPCWTDGALTTAGYLRGVEKLLMDMLMDPDTAKKVIAKGNVWSDDVARATYAEDVGYLLDTDPVASASLIDSDMFKEFVFEPTRQNILGWKKDLKIPIALHICGDTTPMLEQFTQLGHEIQSIDSQVNIANARKIVGDRLTLLGNINPVELLWRGTKEEVKAATKKCFEDGGRDGRFIFGPGCAMPRDAPIENLKAMVEVSKECHY